MHAAQKARTQRTCSEKDSRSAANCAGCNDGKTGCCTQRSSSCCAAAAPPLLLLCPLLPLLALPPALFASATGELLLLLFPVDCLKTKEGLMERVWWRCGMERVKGGCEQGEEPACVCALHGGARRPDSMFC